MKKIGAYEITDMDSETHGRNRSIYHPKGIKPTDLECPLCKEIIYLNIKTKRYRCFQCGILFNQNQIERIKQKQLLREDWIRMQNS